MSESPQPTDLGSIGQGFRASIDREQLKTDISQEALDYIDMVPDQVLGAYSGVNFHHLTPASNLPEIHKVGLVSGTTPIEPEDREFFIDALIKFHHGQPHPQDIASAKNMILGAPEEGHVRQIAVTGAVDEFHQEVYAVPETVKFFLRNLAEVVRINAVDSETVEHSKELLKKYKDGIAPNGKVETAVIKIDPRSPALIGAVLCATDFRALPVENSVNLITGLIQREGDLKLWSSVAPEHIIVEKVIEQDPQKVMDNIFGMSGMLVFKPYSGQRLD